MNGLINVASLLLYLGLIPYAIPTVMPNWRWLLITASIVGGLLFALWVQDWIMTSNPLYHEGIGGALGRGLALIATVSFAVGAGVRALSIFLRSRDLRLRYVVALCAAGFAIVPTIFVVPGLWQQWQHRPPSQACRAATFKVSVGGATFALPSTSMFSIYLGRTSRTNAYHLETDSGQRDFCGLTDHGKHPVEATNISLRLRNFALRTPALCSDPIPDWAATYCAAHAAARQGKQDVIDFPLDVNVFAAEAVNLGEFLGSRSTFEDSQHPELHRGDDFVRSDVIAGGQPLTFQCHDNDSGTWCRTSYPWRDGANLGYTFQSGRDEVAARGVRIDAETRRFLSGFAGSR